MLTSAASFVKLVPDTTPELRLAGARTFSSLRRHRNYRLFFAGQITSVCGTWMQNIALYFAQMEVHRATHGSYPVFLLDDVEAELDAIRLELLLDHLGERTQTFLTTAKETLVPALRGGVARYYVEAGTARLRPSSPKM